MQAYRLAVADGIERWLALVEAQGISLSADTRRRIRANDMRALQACIARDRPDASAALAALKVPLLAIAGTQDPIFDAVKAFAERAGGSFVALQDRNHVTGFLDADVVAAAVEEFLPAAACPPGQGG
jgi:pimeloyl-ACP methyl ester carboxylesterase